MQRHTSASLRTDPPQPPFLVSLRQALVQRAGRPVLRVEHFTLRPGEHWAVLGPNGAGKSSFLALLRGELWPLAPEDPAAPPPRLYGFTAPPSPSPLTARPRMALVSAETQLPYQQEGRRITALEAVLAGFFDALLLYRPVSPEQEEQALASLAAMGVAHLAQRLTPTLSQGELRRVLIARALAALATLVSPPHSEPGVLLLDEVCDGLDPQARGELLARLEQLMTRPNLQLVCTTHRADEMPRGLQRLALVEPPPQPGDYARLRVQDSLPARCASPSALLPRPLPVTAEPLERLLKSFRPARPSGTELLTIRNADVYKDGCRILSDVTWSLRQGEHWGVLGPNGAGKSTFLALVCGRLHPAGVRAPAGEVLRSFTGERETIAALQERLGLVSPELQGGWPYDSTALETVLSGCAGRIGLHGFAPSREQEALALAWLEAFGLGGEAQRPLRRLSTGQQRRVFLARAMLAGQAGTASAPTGPALLVLDEPCSGLDAGSRALFLELLGRVARAEVPLLLVSHHQDDLIPEISHLLLLREGRVQRQGPRATVLTEEALP